MSLDPHWSLDDLRHPDARRPGPVDDGVHDSRARAALVQFKPMSQVATAETLPRPRQADVRVRACCGRTSRLAAAHHLVGEPARRDPVLPRAAARPVGAGQHRAAARPVRAAVPAAAVARPQAQPERSCARIALFILVMRVVDIAWTIGPVFRHEGSTLQLARLRRRARHGRRSGCVLLLAQPRAAARSCRRTIRTSRKRWLMADTKHRTHRDARSARSKATASATSGIVWFVVDPAGHDARVPGPDVGHASRVHIGRRRPSARRWRRAGAAAIGRRIATGHRRRAGAESARRTSRRTSTASATQEDDVLTTYGWVDKNARRRAHSDRAREGAAARARACPCAAAPRTATRRRRSKDEVAEVKTSRDEVRRHDADEHRRVPACWSRRRRVVVCVDASAQPTPPLSVPPPARPRPADSDAEGSRHRPEARRAAAARR